MTLTRRESRLRDAASVWRRRRGGWPSSTPVPFTFTGAFQPLCLPHPDPCGENPACFCFANHNAVAQQEKEKNGLEFHAKSGEESNVVDPKQVSSPQVATNSAEPSHLPAEVRSEAAWAIDAPETSRSGRGGDGGSEATESAEELLNEVSAHETLSASCLPNADLFLPFSHNFYCGSCALFKPFKIPEFVRNWRLSRFSMAQEPLNS